MVFVNEKKFACEACIKGHRSSSCHHTERPLFEVKKKGRPVSQCLKCRELRQAKRVHSKCTCTPRQPAVDKVPIPAARPDKKPRRFMPSVPTLPNGISDALQPATLSPPPDARQRVDSLLNPCHCMDVRQCTCRGSSCIAGPSTSAERRLDCGLQTLAEAAAMFRERPLRDFDSPHSSGALPASCCADEQAPMLGAFPATPAELPQTITGSMRSPSIPEFIPSSSTTKSLPKSGCMCDSSCICPGCIKHRTTRHADKHYKDCHEGCSHCVDRTTGIEQPLSGQNPSGQGGASLVDIFFARAAALPNPSPHRRRSVDLDPGDVTIYPSDLFSGSSTEPDSGRGAAFGLIKIPKLECCRGQCNCPTNECQCGRSCGGGCNSGGRTAPP